MQLLSLAHWERDHEGHCSELHFGLQKYKKNVENLSFQTILTLSNHGKNPRTRPRHQLHRLGNH